MKQNLSRLVLARFNLAKFVLRLYPMASSIVYKSITPEKIDVIRNLLILQNLPDCKLVRVGSPSDGGYVIVDNLTKNDICLSFGVGDNWSFDLEISKMGNSVIMYDHTISTPANLPENIFFNSKGIGVSTSDSFVSIHESIKQVPEQNEIILKIDIEGAEWETLGLLTLAERNRCKQIIAEFHNFHDIGSEKLFNKILVVLSALNETHHLVNLHANNWSRLDLISGVPFPDVIEVTYLRKDQIQNFSTEKRDLLSNLNAPNNDGKHEQFLNFVKFIS